MYKCRACSRTFARHGDYATHVKDCRTSKLCTYCGKELSTPSSARRHETTCVHKEVSKDVLELRITHLENSLAEVLKYFDRWKATRELLHKCKQKNKWLEDKVGHLEYRLENLEKQNVTPSRKEETKREELDIEIDPIWIYRGITKNPREPWKKIISEVMDANNADVQGCAVVCGYDDKYDIWQYASEILKNAAKHHLTFVDSAFSSGGERLYEPNTYAMTEQKKPWRKFACCVLNDIEAMKSVVIDYMDTFR